ncbi:MAG: ATP-dependent DNA helicase RecG [Candidatus Eisenbacteria bacterium]|nr:ATP-dependent DNA helicase RecG [Candidatus Eisenbacteria bacterium]
MGPQRARLLARLGLETAADLARHFPRRHVDRTTLVPVSQLRPGDRAGVLVRVVSGEARRTRSGRTDFVARVADDTGPLTAIFYHQSYLSRILVPGVEVMLWGTPEYGREGVLRGPEFEVVSDEDREQLHLGRIVPLYPGTAGLSQRAMRGWVRQALEGLAPPVEALPADLLAARSLMPAAEALREIHFPSDWGRLARARDRFVFEEFLALQWTLLTRRARVRSVPSPVLDCAAAAARAFVDALPFMLTGPQHAALEAIGADLRSGHAMQRLLLGDVGSGKTVVALTACAAAQAAGRQAAVLAPTEILARQHFASAQRFMAPLGTRVALVVSAMKAKERRTVLAALEAGEVDLAVGTHALLEERVRFRSLALAVIDEQHRFGVEQRARMADKARGVHQLILTATPIPRTLALALYGDLDVTAMRGKPPGRQPVRTRLSSNDRRESIYEYMEERVREGRQAYVVYPAVEESDRSSRKAATRMCAELRRHPRLGRLRIGLAHGQLPAAERQTAMDAFRRGELDVLVATTVIEVGVDVPNACFMLVEQAELFGLSQLHQLRGRVGRGPHGSVFAMLPSEEAGQEALARLRVLEQTEDGFKIAEEDLKLRGPGEVAGTRQSGLPELRLADLARDLSALEAAREEAAILVREDPELVAPGHAGLRALLEGVRGARRLATTA